MINAASHEEIEIFSWKKQNIPIKLSLEQINKILLIRMNSTGEKTIKDCLIGDINAYFWAIKDDVALNTSISLQKIAQMMGEHFDRRDLRHGFNLDMMEHLGILGVSISVHRKTPVDYYYKLYTLGTAKDNLEGNQFIIN